MQNNLLKMMSTLKNGILIRTAFIYQKTKKNNKELLNILWDEGFILGYKMYKTKNKLYTFKIFLKYTRSNSVISSIKFISKPGLKIYCSLKQLWKLNLVKGLLIISTNKGLKTLTECKKLKLGGELLFLVK
jgi:small subunit ribosomal protein S8